MGGLDEHMLVLIDDVKYWGEGGWGRGLQPKTPNFEFMYTVELCRRIYRASLRNVWKHYFFSFHTSHVKGTASYCTLGSPPGRCDAAT